MVRLLSFLKKQCKMVLLTALLLLILSANVLLVLGQILKRFFYFFFIWLFVRLVCQRVSFWNRLVNANLYIFFWARYLLKFVSLNFNRFLLGSLNIYFKLAVFLFWRWPLVWVLLKDMIAFVLKRFKESLVSLFYLGVLPTLQQSPLKLTDFFLYAYILLFFFFFFF